MKVIKVRTKRNPWRALLNRVYSSSTPQYNLGVGTQQARKGHDVGLTEEDLIAQFARQKGRCYWLGIKLDILDVYKTWAPLAPGVDRLDNERGYFPDNIVIACRFANLGRGPTTVERFAPEMRKLRKQIANEMWPKYLFDESEAKCPGGVLSLIIAPLKK